MKYYSLVFLLQQCATHQYQFVCTGNRPPEPKGKNAIEVNDGNELIQALIKLRDAVLGGELDA